MTSRIVQYIIVGAAVLAVTYLCKAYGSGQWNAQHPIEASLASFAGMAMAFAGIVLFRAIWRKRFSK